MKQRFTLLSVLSILGLLFSVSISAQSGNNCNNAIPLTVNINNCSFTQVTNEGLTNSGQAPTVCTGFAGGDLWLSLVAPPSGEVAISSQFIFGTSNLLMNINMAAYTGTCGSLTQVDCDEDSGPGNYPAMTLSGLTPGQTVFLQFWDVDNNQQSPFEVCANGTPVCTSPTASFTPSCAGNNEYEVDVNITSLGDATEVAITDENGAFVSGITTTGVYTVGPFDLGSEVTLTVEHAEDMSCNVSETVSDIGLGCENVLTCGSPLAQSYCYGNNESFGFLYTSPSLSDVTITFTDGLITQIGDDRLRIRNGSNASAPVIYDSNNQPNNPDQEVDLAGLVRVADSGSMYVQITTDVGGSCQDGSLGLGGGWSWTVDCSTDGGYCIGIPELESEVTFAASNGVFDLAEAGYSGLAQCDGPGSNPDMFFKFTAVGSVTYFQVDASGDFDPVIEIFDACGGSQLACVNDDGPGQDELTWLTGLTVGQEYAYRVYNAGSGNPVSTVFTTGVRHIPQVQLRTFDCGATDLVANSIIRSNWPVPNTMVSGFVFEFTELEAPFNVYEVPSPNGANPQFRIYWFDDFEYGRSYSVRTKVRMYEGPNESDYGPACTITMASEAVSALQPQYADQFYQFCDVVRAVPVSQATNYRWVFDDGVETIEYNSNSGNYFCSLQNVNGLEMATSYTVEVFVTSQGTESTTSIPRTINMLNSVPNTQLNPNFVACGSTVPISSNTQAFNVCAADYYTFRFTNTVTQEQIEKIRPNRVIVFSQVNGLEEGESYNVAVKAFAGGIDGDYSTECAVSFALPPGFAENDDEIVGFTEETENSSNDDLLVKSALNVYPNPISDGETLITITDLQTSQQDVMIRVMDLSGRVVATERFGNMGSDFNAVLHLDDKVSTGVYILTATVDGELIETTKLIVE